MVLVAFDDETGELIGKGGSYRTPEQLDKIKQIQAKEKYRKRGNRHFVQCFLDPIREVTPHLSLTVSGAIMKLLLYMKLNNGGLLQDDDKPLKQSDIKKILGKGKTQTAAIIKHLEELSLLLPIKDGRSKLFRMNEKFHIMGKRNKKDHFTKVLTTKLREAVGQLKLEHLGFLYKILPFFHYEKCVLAHNPNEKDESKVQYMNRNELAVAINHDVDTITKLVRQLAENGLIMVTNSSRNVLYYVHPDLMYRQENDGNNDYCNALRQMFENHQRESKRRSAKKRD
ncbi:hypothetical protein [Bacillus sp. RS11]|uniref:hypothetical protein n=1 Tax=Lysinibacillus sp. RS11 TaxID=3242682 RepID=UPI0035C6E6A5